MKFFNSISLSLLAFIPALLAQEYEEQDPPTVDPFDTYDVYQDKFFPAVAVASFTGPSIVGEFSFYQDNNGLVTATGAFHKGLQQDREYQFRFHEGPDCENLGQIVMEHYFESMHVLDLGGTPPIQEPLNDIHLTGQDGYMGLPWVLSDGIHDLACVVLKGHDETKE